MKRSLTDKPVLLELNKSIEVTPSSTPAVEMHDFMPMPQSLMPFHPINKEMEDEVAQKALFMQVLRQNLKVLWHHQIMEINRTSVFKRNYALPLTRIKKVMKSDEEVKMISKDTPILFAKACELFIMDLTLRAWLQSDESKRQTLQRCDIAQAIRREEVFDFLVKVVPPSQEQDDEKEKGPAEVEPPPFNQFLPFPWLDLNADQFIKIHEAPRPLMIKPPMLLTEFGRNPASECAMPQARPEAEKEVIGKGKEKLS